MLVNYFVLYRILFYYVVDQFYCLLYTYINRLLNCFTLLFGLFVFWHYLNHVFHINNLSYMIFVLFGSYVLIHHLYLCMNVTYIHKNTYMFNRYFMVILQIIQFVLYCLMKYIKKSNYSHLIYFMYEKKTKFYFNYTINYIILYNKMYPILINYSITNFVYNKFEDTKEI